MTNLIKAIIVLVTITLTGCQTPTEKNRNIALNSHEGENKTYLEIMESDYEIVTLQANQYRYAKSNLNDYALWKQIPANEYKNQKYDGSYYAKDITKLYKQALRAPGEYDSSLYWVGDCTTYSSETYNFFLQLGIKKDHIKLVQGYYTPGSRHAWIEVLVGNKWFILDQNMIFINESFYQGNDKYSIGTEFYIAE